MYSIYVCILQILKNDPNVERVEEDNPICVDVLRTDNETETDSGRSRRSFEPDEICWNIDRIDERSLPLDGDYCPPVQGMQLLYMICSINALHNLWLACK